MNFLHRKCGNCGSLGFEPRCCGCEFCNGEYGGAPDAGPQFDKPCLCGKCKRGPENPEPKKAGSMYLEGVIGNRLCYFVKELNESDHDVILDLEDRKVCEVEEANVVSSLCKDGLHSPVIDIDLPCRLVPSTSEEHYHLYIEKKLNDEQYFKLLSVMAEVGIISDYYLKASQARGQTFCRLPWIKKPQKGEP